jgi:hypothetical protein
MFLHQQRQVAVNVQNEVQQQVQYFHAADYGPHESAPRIAQ